MIVEIKKTESGCTYKFDDSAYLGKSEKEHEKVINDVSTIINEHLRSRKDKTAQAVERRTSMEDCCYCQHRNSCMERSRCYPCTSYKKGRRKKECNRENLLYTKEGY